MDAHEHNSPRESTGRTPMGDVRRRKRPRSVGRAMATRMHRSVTLANRSRDDAAVRTMSPVQVDKDLLVQVLRVKVRAMIRNYKQQERDARHEGRESDAAQFIAKLEKLLPMVDTHWMQTLLARDKPHYGFCEVVHALRALAEADADA